MKTSYLIALLACFTLFVGCGGCGDLCPPDEKVGEIDLDEDTKAWLPYDGTETLIFSDQDGNELSITAINGKEESIDMACVKQICTEPDDFDPNSTCEFYDAESIRFTFGNLDNFLADIGCFSEVVRPESEEFYQVLNVTVSYGNAIGTGKLLTKTIPEQAITLADVNQDNPFTLIPSVTLNGQTYNEVLKSEDVNLTVYYSKSQGLVGFETDTETWNLK